MMHLAIECWLLARASPTTQIEGRVWPDLNGRVDLAEEKLTFLPWVPRSVKQIAVRFCCDRCLSRQ